MEEPKTFENYPLWMVFLAQALAWAIYLIGGYVMFNLGLIWGWLYVAYCLFLEIKVMRGSCIHCYYYGKWCGLGRGRLAALFFRKGEGEKFLAMELTWKDLVPDLLVSLIPFVLGIYLLFMHFSWLLLLLLLLLFILTSAGNGFVRGNLACKYCKQRELGCPAEKLFSTP